MRALRIATRKSALALWQARHVQSLLLESDAGLSVSLVPVVTEGDRILDRPLATIGGKGLFLKELEKAVLDGDADLAVHSMKDVPADMAPGLVLDVVLARANPFDALVCRSAGKLAELAPGSRVGTSSLRRRCQLLAARPDLVVEDLRGNVDTRLRKLDAGAYDAIILACAGLERLGLGERITEVLGPPAWVPASTQGTIGIQYRADDASLAALLQPLNDPDTLACALAERTVARRLEGSCQLPLAVYAELAGDAADRLDLQALVGMPDGTSILRASQQGSRDEPEALGLGVAEALLEQGAAEIIAALS
ncbi:MAG: hydroxymethylbilane synthase [Xanthomonadales bacterium]|nr:hydroxymethylbilane synthase [Xanthomonadales bacterium]